MTGACCRVEVRVTAADRTYPEMSAHTVVAARTFRFSCPNTGSSSSRVPGGGTGVAGWTPISAMICGNPAGAAGGAAGGAGAAPVAMMLAAAAIVTVVTGPGTDRSPGVNDPGSGDPGHAGACAAGSVTGDRELRVSYSFCSSAMITAGVVESMWFGPVLSRENQITSVYGFPAAARAANRLITWSSVTVTNCAGDGILVLEFDRPNSVIPNVFPPASARASMSSRAMWFGLRTRSLV